MTKLYNLCLNSK